jgi:transcriptional repressor NF-X1
MDNSSNIPTDTGTGTSNQGRPRNSRRPRPPQNNQGSGENPSSQQPPGSANQPRPNKPARPRQPKPPQAGGAPSELVQQPKRRNQRKRNPNANNAHPPNENQSTPGSATPTDDGQKHATSSRQPGKGRAARFNAGLTTASESSGSRQKGSSRHHFDLPQGDDLTSALTRGLSISPYADCPICFNPIHPAQPTWSCSPSIPIVLKDQSIDGTSAAPQYCWSTFHLKCIKPWAEKSFKDVKEAWRTRGEPDKDGEWRCPGCQGRRTTLIDGYRFVASIIPVRALFTHLFRCFCGTAKSPQPRLGIPHSCGNLCSRPRTSCSHPCPLACHPGPCPPCKIVMAVTCGCPRKEVSNIRCADAVHSTEEPTFSCGNVCSRALSCGNPNHRCDQVCHPGNCRKCIQTETLKCWCSKHERTGICGEVQQPWVGPIGCGDLDGITTIVSKGFTCGEPCRKWVQYLQYHLYSSHLI